MEALDWKGIRSIRGKSELGGEHSPISRVIRKTRSSKILNMIRETCEENKGERKYREASYRKYLATK